MSLYWIHVKGGDDGDAADRQAVMYGPFENDDVFARFHATYGDVEDGEGRRRSVDELPMLPGINEYDDHETDTWIALQGEQVFLFGNRDTFAVQERDAFVVVNQEFRAGPLLSD